MSINARAVARPGAFGALLITLLAFALRIYRLGHQSFWYDEALSYYYASQGLRELLAGVSSSDHPPLYFLLLHLWSRWAGNGEFSLRFLSLLWSVSSVPLLYALGRRLLNREAGLIASLLMAFSPFHVWYAQETRMYTLATFLTLLSSMFLLFILREGKGRAWWVAYAGVNVLAVYAHFYAFLVLPFHLIYGLWQRWGKGGAKGALPLMSAQALTVLAFVPWLPFALYQYAYNATYWPGALRLLDVLKSTATSIAVGSSLGGGAATSLSALYWLLVLLGLAALAWQARRALEGRERGFAPFLFLFLYLVIPALLLLLLLYRRPKFAPRYLLQVTPACYLLVAWGLLTLRRWRRGMGLAYVMGMALLLGFAFSLYNYYFVEAYARDDFRSLVRYVNEEAEKGDAVILVGGHIYPVFVYYDRLGLPLYPVRPGLLPRVNEPVDSAWVGRLLNEVASRHRRVWLVLWQEELADPWRVTLNYLLRYTPRLPVEGNFHGLALLLFSLESRPRFPLGYQAQHSLRVTFADNLELVGYDLTRGGWVRDKAGGQRETSPDSFEPGEFVFLALYWRARGPVKADYTAFTHIVGPDGRLYGGWDRPLGEGFYPSSQWPAGEVFRGEYMLPISREAPPGLYFIEVGLYSPETGDRLPILDSDGRPVLNQALVLTQVELKVDKN